MPAKKPGGQANRARVVATRRAVTGATYPLIANACASVDHCSRVRYRPGIRFRPRVPSGIRYRNRARIGFKTRTRIVSRIISSPTRSRVHRRHGRRLPVASSTVARPVTVWRRIAVTARRAERDAERDENDS
jgi:hypothetical protein